MAELALTAAGIVLSPFFQVFFERMASREFDDFFKRQKLSDKLLRNLKTGLLSVNAVLEDAEDKQFTKPDVKEWLDELKDTVYDVENILDKIATKDLLRKLDAEFGTIASKVIQSEMQTLLVADGQLLHIFVDCAGSNWVKAPLRALKRCTIHFVGASFCVGGRLLLCRCCSWCFRVAEDSFVIQLAKLTDTPFSSSGDNFAIGVTAHGSEQLQQEPDGFEQTVDPTFDNCVRCALIDGDYKGQLHSEHVGGSNSCAAHLI